MPEKPMSDEKLVALLREAAGTFFNLQAMAEDRGIKVEIHRNFARFQHSPEPVAEILIWRQL
jgi:hypothetical protein